jgi:PAS domain S-box-containing protein
MVEERRRVGSVSVSQPYVQIGLLGEAVDGAPVAVMVADEHGDFVAVNRFACTMLGYTREELVALRVQDITVEPDVAAHYARFVSERFDSGTAVLRRKDGSTFSYEYRAGETTIAGLAFYVSVGFLAEG